MFKARTNKTAFLATQLVPNRATPEGILSPIKLGTRGKAQQPRHHAASSSKGMHRVYSNKSLQKKNNEPVKRKRKSRNQDEIHLLSQRLEALEMETRRETKKLNALQAQGHTIDREELRHQVEEASRRLDELRIMRERLISKTQPPPPQPGQGFAPPGQQHPPPPGGGFAPPPPPGQHGGMQQLNQGMAGMSIGQGFAPPGGSQP